MTGICIFSDYVAPRGSSEAKIRYDTRVECMHFDVQRGASNDMRPRPCHPGVRTTTNQIGP